jgi:integrase
MATIIERTTKSGERRLYVMFSAIDRDTRKRRKVWELVGPYVVGGDGQPRLAGRKDANLRKSEVEVALGASKGLWPPQEPRLVMDEETLETRGRAWLERHKVNLRDRVHQNYQASLEKHIYPAIGTRPMNELGPADAKTLRDEMRAKGLSDDTIRAALSPLRGMVADWAEDAKQPNPIAGLRLFGAKGKTNQRKVKPPTKDVIDEVLLHARNEAKDAIRVAAASGLRRGELFGLRWRDVDFGESLIHVTAYNFGGVVEDGRFKTDAGERDVPLFKSIRKTLLERKARVRFSSADDFVFASNIGTALDPNNFVKRELKPSIDRANAKRKESNLKPLPAFRWHDFRHYAVSRLIAQKADILTVARIAGHADPNVTLKVYGHLMEGALAEAAELYDPLSEATA